MYTVLICDDDRDIVSALEIYLSSEGYRTVSAYNGEEAIRCVNEDNIDLILMDIMMPQLDGIRATARLRESGGNIPIILLTAKSEDTDKVLGLNIGADDYITKPFEIVELLARVETVMRRYNKIGKVIHILDVEIDLTSRIVLQNGKQILLTLKEYELLLFFARNPNIALYREVIYEQVWEKEYTGDSRTVDLHVQRLKKKLSWDRHICAVYKIGYRLET